MPNYLNVYTKRDIHYFNGLWVDNDLGTPITGIKKSFYPDGKVQDETPLSEGMIDGVQLVYDPEGTVWWENTWHKNVLVSYKKIA